MDDIATTARILSEALPFLQRYDDQIIVVKFGGHAMVDRKLSQQFARDIGKRTTAGVMPSASGGGRHQSQSQCYRPDPHARPALR